MSCQWPRKIKYSNDQREVVLSNERYVSLHNRSRISGTQPSRSAEVKTRRSISKNGRRDKVLITLKDRNQLPYVRTYTKYFLDTVLSADPVPSHPTSVSFDDLYANAKLFFKERIRP